MIHKTNVHNYTRAKPLHWQDGRNTRKLNFVTKRAIMHYDGSQLGPNNKGQRKLKYMEKISFNTNGNNYAIAIGYNPASDSSDAIDKTNYLISTHLSRSGYDGYYLFNMYPDVSVTKVRKYASYRSDYINILMNFLINYPQINNYDIFIFWGSSVYVSDDVMRDLITLKNRCHEIFTIGTTNVNHQHPGRGVSVATINHHKINLPPTPNGTHYLR